MAARNLILLRYKGQAKQRGLIWALSEEDFDRLTKETCHYCGLPPANKKRLKSGDFIYSGLDRKDNDRNYEIDNVVASCAGCNRFKGKMPYLDFLAYLGRISEHHSKTTTDLLK